MRPLPDPTDLQFGVFTARQAYAEGWSESALRHAVRAGDLERVRAGVYALPLEPGAPWEEASTRLARTAAAAALTVRRAFPSHLSAAAMMRLPIVETRAHSCVTVLRASRSVSGLHTHQAPLLRDDVGRLGNVLLLRAARTVVDSAREFGLDQGVALADAVLRDGGASRADLEAMVRRQAGWPGSRTAVTAVAMADPRSESALESVSRVRLAAAGYRPEPQVWIYTESGIFVRRVDFLVDGVACESDGFDKYERNRGLFRSEGLQHEDLEDLGLPVVRWGWADLSSFDAVVARLERSKIRAARSERRWIGRPSPLIAAS